MQQDFLNGSNPDDNVRTSVRLKNRKHHQNHEKLNLTSDALQAPISWVKLTKYRKVRGTRFDNLKKMNLDIRINKKSFDSLLFHPSSLSLWPFWNIHDYTMYFRKLSNQLVTEQCLKLSAEFVWFPLKIDTNQIDW